MRLSLASAACTPISAMGLLRAMALRGVAAAEADRKRELIEDLIEWINSPDWPPMSADELERTAWDVDHKLSAERRERSADPDG